MIVESRNVFLIHPENEQFLNGHRALPCGWKSGFFPILIFKFFLLEVACILLPRLYGVNQLIVIFVSVAYFTCSVLIQFRKTKEYEWETKKGKLIFTDDFEASFFASDGANCKVNFVFPAPEAIRGEAYGDSTANQLAPQMCLCALFIDKHHFYVL